MEKISITKGIKYGLIAGLVSTIITDIVSLIIFIFLGESLPTFFALIGTAFLTLINLEATYPLWQGLTLHYSIGLITGLTLGILNQRISVLRFDTYRRSIITGVIITQIEGLALFYLMSLILNIPQSEMIIMYGLGIFLHTIWGTCLGLIISFGQKRSGSIPVHSGISKIQFPKESIIKK
jgi:hypothetical protein